VSEVATGEDGIDFTKSGVGWTEVVETVVMLRGEMGAVVVGVI
jgi:hypothetical protein